MQSPYFTAGLLRMSKGLCWLTDAELELDPGPLMWSVALLPYVVSWRSAGEPSDVGQEEGEGRPDAPAGPA